MVFCLQTDEHTAPGATQSPLWYASQHLQDGEVISFECTSDHFYLHCMYIPAETDHIDAELGSREPYWGFQHDPAYGKFNNQFHMVKLHEPKKASRQTKLSPRKDVWMQACNIQSIRQKVSFTVNLFGEIHCDFGGIILFRLKTILKSLLKTFDTLQD